MNRVEIVGLGTAAIGRPQYINVRQGKSAAVSLEEFRLKGMKMLDEAFANGIRYFDTAPGYGLAEKLLIDWLRTKDDDSIEVATKWGYTYVAGFDPKAQIHEVKEHSLNKLNEQWEQSKNLLPWLSTYQIHSATLDTGVLDNEPILNRLAELKENHGLIIGLSTTGTNQIEVLKKALNVEIKGIALFDEFQVTYNVFDKQLAKIADHFNNKRLVIKEALANGRVFPNKNYPDYSKAYSLLSTLSKKYGVGIDAIALRFCVDSIPAFKVLSGAANLLHLSDNLKTSQFELEEDDIGLLKELNVPAEKYWNERKHLIWN